MRTARPVLVVGAAFLAAVCSCTAPPGTAGPAPATFRATSTGPTPPPRALSGLAGPPVVVLDPGHNGRNAQHPELINRPVPDGRGGVKPCNTTGTATDAGYPEHAFAFDVAGRVAQLLTAAGTRVVLTRADDDGVGPCVDERGRAGEAAGAAAVVAIHADGAAPRGGGYHVALSEPPVHPVQERDGRVLATALRDAMRAAGFRDSDYTGHEGLSPRSDLAGLNHATRPTVLVECANMRNPAEAALVSAPEGRQRYAAAIAAGVLAFLGGHA